MVQKLTERLRHKDVRRTLGLILAGKALGILLVLLAIKGRFGRRDRIG